MKTQTESRGDTERVRDGIAYQISLHDRAATARGSRMERFS